MLSSVAIQLGQEYLLGLCPHKLLRGSEGEHLATDAELSVR